VLSRRGLCDELIARLEESYRLWCVVECDLETSWMRRPWPTGDCCAKIKKNVGFTLQQFCLMERKLKIFEGNTTGWNLTLRLFHWSLDSDRSWLHSSSREPARFAGYIVPVTCRLKRSLNSVYQPIIVYNAMGLTCFTQNLFNCLLTFRTLLFQNTNFSTKIPQFSCVRTSF